MSRLILGTRGSDLARAQTRIVEEKLRAAHPSLELAAEVVRTTGDARLDLSLSQPGALDKGLFTRELEQALLAGAIDAAVHSLKDLPIEQPPGLVLGAILERANPADVLVTKQPGGLKALSPGAVVATSSPRRKAQLLNLRSDLSMVDIRGNVPTRLRKLAEDPALDGLLIAQAGLDRLGPAVVPAGLHQTVIEEILPAPGQGAIAVQCRAGDTATLEFLRPVHHEETAACVTAEREFLRSRGGGCHLPLGALAVVKDGEIILRTFEPS